MGVGPEELALRLEPLVPRDASARDGRILRLLAVQRSDLRQVRAAGCGAGRIGTGEESAVHRAQPGAEEPWSARRAPIGAAVQEEEEEQHQGDGGEGPDPARLRRDHRRRGQGHGFPGTGMPNLRLDLGGIDG